MELGGAGGLARGGEAGYDDELFGRVGRLGSGFQGVYFCLEQGEGA